MHAHLPTLKTQLQGRQLIGDAYVPLGEVTRKVGGSQLDISRKTVIVYLAADFWASLPASAISWQFYNAEGRYISPTEGFYDIDGKPSRMTVTVDNDVIKTNKPGDFLFMKEGHGTVTLSIAGQSTQL